MVALLLLLAAVPARAEWVKVEEGKGGFFSSLTGDVVYYYDPSTIVREGSIRRVWEIHDLRDKGPQGERSVLAQVEYDCADKRMRTLKATGRSQRMASGAIIPMSRIFEEWVVLQPGKEDAIYFKILGAVCAP